MTTMPPAQPATEWPPPQPPYRNRAPRRGWLAAVGIVVGLLAIGIAANNGTGEPRNSASTAPAHLATALPSAQASATAATTTPAPRVLLTVTGNGIKNTRTFQAPDHWTLSYSFDCANFGSSGNFAVTAFDGPDPVDFLANELAPSGKDTTDSYTPGTLHLQINSECSWTIRVTG